MYVVLWLVTASSMICNIIYIYKYIHHDNCIFHLFIFVEVIYIVNPTNMLPKLTFVYMLIISILVNGHKILDKCDSETCMLILVSTIP